MATRYASARERCASRYSLSLQLTWPSIHERDFEVHSASHTLPVVLEDCRELGSGEKPKVPRRCASSQLVGSRVKKMVRAGAGEKEEEKPRAVTMGITGEEGHVRREWIWALIGRSHDDQTLLTGRRRWQARHGRSDQLQWRHVEDQLQWWHVELHGYSTAILVLVVFAAEIVSTMDVGSDGARKTQHDNGSPFFGECMFCLPCDRRGNWPDSKVFFSKVWISA